MAPNPTPPGLLVVGAGNRGTTYAEYTRTHPDAGRVTAVADPDPRARDRLAERHGVPPERCFRDWRDALAAPRVADAVIIATQDRDHAAPAIAFATAGWPLLLEKPMAPTAAECRAVVAAVERAGVLFAVAHVLRYTPGTTRVMELIRAGAVGEVVGVQRLEPVGFWHFAHSYVRGNWRREDTSSPVLLAKCCHDLDWIRHVIGVPCREVTSFAGRFAFRPERRPPGASDRCVTCSVEPTCPYSAVRLYLGRALRGDLDWPVSVLAHDPTVATVQEALAQGPYGRCVYACDNDVPDQQVVNLAHEGDRTASFTMSAFTPFTARKSTIFGTHGCLVEDGTRLVHHDFVTGCQTSEPLPATGAHAGGDDGLMAAFLAAVATDDARPLRAGPAETLESHLMVFAAERARHERRAVRLDEPS